MNKRGIYIWWAVGIICGLFSVMVFLVAAAAFIKAHGATVIRNGFYSDYMTLATVMGVMGLVFAGAAVFCLTRRRKLPPPPDSHF